MQRPDLEGILKNFLQEAGYGTVLANDGVEALSTFSAAQFDLVLLDVMLPKIDGFAVCELIRKQSEVPVIMLTALNGEEEQIRGLDLQVDDYITKPFSMPILIRKIAAVLRRSAGPGEDEHKTIAYQNLVLDCDNYTATVEGSVYELTRREFEVLKELLTHQGRILTRQNLLDKLWRYDFYGDERVVDTHIKNYGKSWGLILSRQSGGWDIKLIKKIKGSLFAKVFIITAVMLLCMSLSVFGMLARLMPQTYSNRLNIILDERAQNFIAELEQVPFSDSGGLFDRFLSDMEINSALLYDSNGDRIPLPAKESDRKCNQVFSTGI